MSFNTTARRVDLVTRPSALVISSVASAQTGQDHQVWIDALETQSEVEAAA